jgi:uncharacterized membrane protein
LGEAEADDDIELVHREIEFAAAERLMFFTDAVVAIALTLLALQLPIPGGIENLPGSISEMVRDAGQHFDDYLAFLISFVVIAAHWRLHHRVFRYVRVASPAIIRLNIYWLLLIVITPFTTRTLSVDHMNILRFGLYAATQAMQFTIFAVINCADSPDPACSGRQRRTALEEWFVANNGPGSQFRGVDPALSTHRTVGLRSMGSGIADRKPHSEPMASAPEKQGDLDCHGARLHGSHSAR